MTQSDIPVGTVLKSPFKQIEPIINVFFLHPCSLKVFSDRSTCVTGNSYFRAFFIVF